MSPIYGHSKTYVLRCTAVLVTQTVIRDKEQSCVDSPLANGLLVRIYKPEI